MNLRGLAITGRPGVGKSTLFNDLVLELKGLGCRVGGISAPEVRSSGKRIGFLIVDLKTGRRGWLAKAGYHSPVKVGRYGVMIDDVKRVGVKALEEAVKRSDIIAIDEVGPMELKVIELRKAIIAALLSDKVKVIVFHRDLSRRDPEVYSFVKKLKVIELTFENRDLVRRNVGRYSRWLANEAGCDKGGKGSDMDR